MYLVMFHKNWKSFLRNIAVTSLAEVWIETLKMGTKITASERVFRLQGCSEDDTIILQNEVSLRRSTTVPVLAYWGGF